MRAMVIRSFGGPEVLACEEIPTPQPGPGEVLVSVAYAGVNPADWKTREGMLSKYIQYQFPFVLGFDLAGTVAAVGPGANFTVGARVFGTSRQGQGKNGSYAEATIADAVMLQRVPATLSLAEAAGLPVAGTTAYGGLVDAGGLKAGQTVLINGGAGGVGSIAIQVARALGAKVATTSRAVNAQYVRSLGAELVIDYQREDIAQAVKRWAPLGVDVVLDAVGLGTLLGQAVDVLKPGGTFVEIETLISEASETDKVQAASKGVRIVSNMIAIARMHEHFASLAALAEKGKVKPPPTEIVPLADAGLAHTRVKAGHVRGKIVLQVR